jgi:hypothetical protein
MSDTPRTDSVREASRGHNFRMIRMIEHARQLERELSQWKACAELFYSCATHDTSCDGWNAAQSMFEKLKGTK